MQKVKIFSNGSMGNLEDAINKWLEEGMVEIKDISYAARPQDSFYSAMVYYVPSMAAYYASHLSLHIMQARKESE